jgi:hypothetical protein
MSRLFRYIPAYVAIRAAGRAPGGYPSIFASIVLGVLGFMLLLAVGVAFIVITGL